MEKYKEIRQKYERNGLYNTYYLAKKYNVSRTLIGLVINNKIWKRVG